MITTYDLQLEFMASRLSVFAPHCLGDKRKWECIPSCCVSTHSGRLSLVPCMFYYQQAKTERLSHPAHSTATVCVCVLKYIETQQLYEYQRFYKSIGCLQYESGVILLWAVYWCVSLSVSHSLTTAPGTFPVSIFPSIFNTVGYAAQIPGKYELVPSCRTHTNTKGVFSNCVNNSKQHLSSAEWQSDTL